MNKLTATNHRNALNGFQRGMPLIFFSQQFCRIASKETLPSFALVFMDNAMQILAGVVRLGLIQVPMKDGDEGMKGKGGGWG